MMNKETELLVFFSGDFDNPTKRLEVDITNLSFKETTTIQEKYSQEYDDYYTLVFDADGNLKDAFCY